MKIQSFLLAATASLAIAGTANAATITGTFATSLFGVTSSTPAIGPGSVLSNAFGLVSAKTGDFASVALGTGVNFAPITATDATLVSFTSSFGDFTGTLSNLETQGAPNAFVNFDALGVFTPLGSLAGFAPGNGRLTVSFTQTGTVIAGEAPSISGSWTFATTAVPEPASWAMLIAGFGLVGVAARRRQTVVAA